MSPFTSGTRPSTRPLSLLLLAAALLCVAALLVNLMGIHLSGGIANWQQWLDAHRLHFFVWRLCLYVSVLVAWPWVRRRRLQRSPQARRQLRMTEVLGLVSIVITEATQWLRPL